MVRTLDMSVGCHSLSQPVTRLDPRHCKGTCASVTLGWQESTGEVMKSSATGSGSRICKVEISEEGTTRHTAYNQRTACDLACSTNRRHLHNFVSSLTSVDSAWSHARETSQGLRAQRKYVLRVFRRLYFKVFTILWVCGHLYC